jgi:uncharacterized protein YggU (UPF0235/DUF167 family)
MGSMDGPVTRLRLRVSPGALGVARGSVQPVSGATGRDKVVELSGVAPEEIDRRLEAAGRKE